MDKAIGQELPLRSEIPLLRPTTPFHFDKAGTMGGQHHLGLERRSTPHKISRLWRYGFGHIFTILSWVKEHVSNRVKATFVLGPPSLVIFIPVAVAATLFIGLGLGLASAQISGEASGALGGFLLVLASLPIALLTTITVSLILPYKAYFSSSTLVSALSSYSPYVLGALTGVWAALWFGKFLPFEYDPLVGLWKLTIAIGGPFIWLLMGSLANHLAALVDRRRDYEKGMEELRESRHRIMLIHEQTRKEVAGLLHGRVQSRMVVLGHWLKECQERMKDGPGDVTAGLENATKLLQEIRDVELRSITRQLYPSIIRTGLPSALNSLADRFRTVFEVELDTEKAIAELENPMRPSLDESVRLGLYRVAEEALSNIAKYSEAGRARVSLSLSPTQEILLVVQDNGRGFEPSKTPPGQGLLSMEDYTTALGGTLEVRSSVGIGTTVKASVPISCVSSSKGEDVYADKSPQTSLTSQPVPGPQVSHSGQSEVVEAPPPKVLTPS